MTIFLFSVLQIKWSSRLWKKEKQKENYWGDKFKALKNKELEADGNVLGKGFL